MFDEHDEAPENNRHYVHKIRTTLTRDQIQTFVNGLHETQWALLEAVVNSRERQGFPEATVVIKHIMEKR